MVLLGCVIGGQLGRCSNASKGVRERRSQVANFRRGHVARMTVTCARWRLRQKLEELVEYCQSSTPRHHPRSFFCLGCFGKDHYEFYLNNEGIHKYVATGNRVMADAACPFCGGRRKTAPAVSRTPQPPAAGTNGHST